MIILIQLRKKIVFIFLIILLVIGLFYSIQVYFSWRDLAIFSVFQNNSPVDEKISLQVGHIIKGRNQALLDQDLERIGTYFNRNIRNGLWAYEHEVKKMKYLHNWANKQGIEFTNIQSDVIIRNGKPKGQGYTFNLLVSTEYVYHYEDEPQKENSFRIGTYHSLDIVKLNEVWVISKEWYTDPFADSLQLEDIKIESIRSTILAGEKRNFSDLLERRARALEYADRYCGAASLPEYGYQYNSKYKNYNPQGGDCANFASQMLYEGGGFRKNRTWNYEGGAGSRAWINAHAFNSYMLNSGRASLIAKGSYEKVLEASYKLEPGDYVAYEKKGEVTHISVVTGADSKGYTLVNSHNTDRYRVPWDLGWSNQGIRFWLVKVYY